MTAYNHEVIGHHMWLHQIIEDYETHLDKTIAGLILSFPRDETHMKL